MLKQFKQTSCVSFSAQSTCSDAGGLLSSGMVKRANEADVDPKIIKVGRHIANVIARASGSKEDHHAELSALRYKLPPH